MVDNWLARLVRRYGRRMVNPPKIQNNDFCFCGSLLKYKHCCKGKPGAEERWRRMWNSKKNTGR